MNKIYLIPSFKHIVKTKVTICKLQCCVCVGELKLKFNVKAQVKCHPEDTYDKELGERLAESKACILAERIAIKRLQRARTTCMEFVTNADASINKLSRMVEQENKHRNSLTL